MTTQFATAGKTRRPMTWFRTNGARRANSLMTRILALSELSRQRKALAHLSDADLADIGIDRAAARRESRRPFWDAPDHWQA